eukprot:TRINITY_DN622_c0_g1_i4.p1 TRINITY_DN622_c0_g1~~TRINITY_DN622_c0_g1_i4.p1  ORF type:complete len:353 (-),score=129.80 TRINITY_DN622_c0_g1_i4:772-1761(-)
MCIRDSSYAETQDEIPTNMHVASRQFYRFLQNLFNSPEFAAYKTTPFYLFGEGFAGHYITNFAEYIYLKNADLPNGAIQLQLAGIGLGNALLDPITQVTELASFAYSVGLVEDHLKDKLEVAQLRITAMLRESDFIGASQIYKEIINAIKADSGRHNEFDLRLPFNYNFTDLEEYFNLPDVRKNYNVLETIGTFSLNNDTVQYRLQREVMVSCIGKLDFLLRNIPVLIYQGQMDISINAAGVTKYINRLTWADKQKFVSTRPSPCWADGVNYGRLKAYGNLHYFILNNAGRSATGDQPQASLNMLDNFIAKKKWCQQNKQRSCIFDVMW